MKEATHERAERLIDAELVEGIPAADRQWLDEHLESCVRCHERLRATERALQSLRMAAIEVRPALVSATQQRVRVRAFELREEKVRLRALWISCALSWVLGVVSAPLLWQGIQWVAGRFALSAPVSITIFVVSWLVPAAAAAGVLVWWRSQTATENSFLPPRS